MEAIGKRKQRRISPLPTVSKTFSSPTMTLSGDQFWFTVLDENSLQVAMIPREQILYIETNFNTAP